MIPAGGWSLRVAGGSQAALDAAAEPGVVRVAITRAGTPTLHDVQLNAAGLELRAHRAYALELRIRAAAPRRCAVGVAQGRHPWSNLGCYRVLELTPSWQDVRAPFTAAAGDADARVHLDVGGDAGAVEIAAVRLHDVEAGADVTPSRPAPAAPAPPPDDSGLPGGLILMYHRVADETCDPWDLCVSPANFAAQMAVVAGQAAPMALASFVAALEADRLPPRAVAVTFDDGYADNLRVAAPILRSAAVPATVFVTTGQIDGEREFWWDELAALLFDVAELPARLELPLDGGQRTLDLASPPAAPECGSWRAEQPPPSARHAVYVELWRLLQPLPQAEQRAVLERLWRQAGTAPPPVRAPHRALTEHELLELSLVDGIAIGAHTVTHPQLSAHPAAVQRCELLESKVALERLLRRPITAVSYPYGAISDETVRLTRALGYRLACTTRPARATAACERWRLPRLQVPDWTGEAFAAQLAAWLPDRG